MNNREWFCLALRLFGIWLMLQSVEEFVPYLLFAFSGLVPGQSFYFIASSVLWLFARTAMGLVLLFFAPAIAVRFYPSTATKENTFSDSVEPAKVGIQLLGVYALLLAVQSGAGVIAGYLAGTTWGLGSAGYFGNESAFSANLINCGLNLAFAAILIIWNERVVALIAKFRYVPERDAYEPPPLNE